MSAGQIALIVVIAAVIVLIIVALFAGRSRRSPADEHHRRLNQADGRNWKAGTADSILDTMEQIHVRLQHLVAEGRTEEAMQLARAMYKITERDPARWVADIAREPHSAPGTQTAYFGPVRSLVARGRTIEAIREYRRITGAGLNEAKKIVDAMVATQD